MKLIQLVLIGLMAACSHSSAQPPIERIDSLVNDAWQRGLFSGIVRVYKDGKPVYNKVLGYADWNRQTPLKENTLYNIGSLNKMFTRELINQLVSENKLKYEDLLSAHLNIYPDKPGSAVTIRQLLEMTAGLGDFLQDPDYNKIKSRRFELSELVDIIKKQPLLFEPGTSNSYSNSGYAVLGAVVEKLTGKSYEQNLKERIFEPLGMRHSFYSIENKLKENNRASGTQIAGNGSKNSIDEAYHSSPAGGVYADINDLHLFIEAMRTGKLPSKRKGESGVFSGGTPVWNSSVGMLPNGVTVLIMANVGRIADMLMDRTEEIAAGKKPRPFPLPAPQILIKALQEKGIDYIEKNVQELTAQAGLAMPARFLNMGAYRLLEEKQFDLALQVFHLNVKLHPNNANLWDSLGEAYLIKGDKAKAKEYYTKALSLDPTLKTALDAMQKLK